MRTRREFITLLGGRRRRGPLRHMRSSSGASGVSECS